MTNNYRQYENGFINRDGYCQNGLYYYITSDGKLRFGDNLISNHNHLNDIRSNRMVAELRSRLYG